MTEVISNRISEKMQALATDFANKYAVRVGNVVVGGDAPVVVQSMTNTDTADYLKTAIQIAELHQTGSELVRITVNNQAAAAAVPRIVEHLDKMGFNVRRRTPYRRALGKNGYQCTDYW